jgi:glyceraldehyde 3-phosphate dehydrogenase
MVLFKNQLLDKNVNEIINLHQYSGEFVGKPINVFSSVEIAKVILSQIYRLQNWMVINTNTGRR